jgi:chemotaxis signal transduction protein
VGESDIRYNGVATLRRAFDAGFAEPRSAVEQARDEYLAVRVCGDPFLIGLVECAGLARPSRIVPVPTRAHGLVGIAAIRGNVVPVFGLGALLGYDASREAPEWLVLCGSGQEVLALGVTTVEGTVRLTGAPVVPPNAGARSHASTIGRSAEGARPIISLPSLLDALRVRAA